MLTKVICTLMYFFVVYEIRFFAFNKFNKIPKVVTEGWKVIGGDHSRRLDHRVISQLR